jgi:hypothetical protein
MTPQEQQIIEEYLKSLAGTGNGPGELRMLANQPGALRSALSNLSTHGEDQALLQQQLTKATEQSNTPMASGGSVRNGIYVAADPSEMLLSAFRRGGGKIEEHKLNDALAAGLRTKRGTTDAYNAWKQGEASDLLTRQANEKYGPPSPLQPDPTSAPMPGQVNFGQIDVPQGPAKKPLATSQRAPGPTPEDGGASLLTDMSPQRGRGYTEPGVPENDPRRGRGYGAPVLPEEVGGASELTDMDPQRGRGYPAPESDPRRSRGFGFRSLEYPETDPRRSRGYESLMARYLREQEKI